MVGLVHDPPIVLIAITMAVFLYRTIYQPKVLDGVCCPNFFLFLHPLVGLLQLEHLLNKDFLLETVLIELPLVDFIESEFYEITIILSQLLLLFVHNLAVLPLLVDFEQIVVQDSLGLATQVYRTVRLSLHHRSYTMQTFQDLLKPLHHHLLSYGTIRLIILPFRLLQRSGADIENSPTALRLLTIRFLDELLVLVLQHAVVHLLIGNVESEQRHILI